MSEWIAVREQLPPQRDDKYYVITCRANSYAAKEGRVLPSLPLPDDVVRGWPQCFTHWRYA